MRVNTEPDLYGEAPDRAPSLASLLRPELPAAAMHGLAGQVAKELAEASGADPAALLVMFLACFGNAAGHEPHAEFGGAPQPGRLFALVVGDAATGRKGTAYEAVEGLFHEADPDWAGTRIEFGLQSAEAMISRVSGGQDPRLLIVETEFGRLIKTMQRAGGLSAQLRNAYDGRPLQRTLSRASHSQSAASAHVSVLGMITPGELLRLHKQVRESGGLESRILYCYSAPAVREVSPFRSAPGGPKWLAVAVREALEASRNAVMAATDPISAYLCTERGIQPHVALAVDDAVAGSWLRAVRPRMPVTDATLGPFFSRGETHVMRLAACYALADRAFAVSGEHIEAALALWSYCARSAERVFGMPLADLPPKVNPAHAAKVLRYLHDHYPDWVPREEIRSAALSGNVPAAAIDAVFASLGEAGLAEGREVHSGKPGRPPTEYRLRVSA